jgi:hypothetical protein
MRDEVIAGIALFHAAALVGIEWLTRGAHFRTERGPALVLFAMALAISVAVGGAVVGWGERIKGLSLWAWLRVALPYWLIAVAGAFVGCYFPGGAPVSIPLLLTLGTIFIVMPGDTVRTFRFVRRPRVDEEAGPAATAPSEGTSAQPPPQDGTGK